MKEVIKLFKQIQEVSGKNDKINIVKANADNELFKKCLVFLLDTNIVTGISKKKLGKKFLTPQSVILVTYTFEDVMEYLKVNNTGRDEDIVYVQQFLSVRPKEDLWFYEGMITKTLKIGMDKKGCNKALPGLIDTWEVQLGSGYDKLKLKDGEKFYISQKMNGTRGSHYEGKLISRQGKAYSGLQHIIDDLNKAGLSKYFVDGELIRKNVDDLSDGENFRIGTGIINSDAESKEEIKFVIFDLVPAEEYKSKKFTTKYSKRKQDLLLLQEKIKEENLQNIEIVPMFYEGTDQTQIMKWLDYAVEHGMEGCMINKDKPYAAKRTTDLIKVKRFSECDIRCIDVEEGEGKNKGTLGAIVCNYKGNQLRVGSGFTDEQREFYWNNEEEIVGKIVTVKYKEETNNKKGGVSLQFGTFICVRKDKDEESYN